MTAQALTAMFCRPKLMRPYLDLLRALNEAHVNYAVAGGLAVVLHGVPRMTFDLDLALDLGDDNLHRLVTSLMREGYRPRLPVELSDLTNPATRESWIRERNLIAFSLFHPARVMEEVDLLLVTTPAWPEIARSLIRRELDGVAVPIVGRATLRAMKLAAGRDKDLADAALLEGDDEA